MIPTDLKKVSSLLRAIYNGDEEKIISLLEKEQDIQAKINKKIDNTYPLLHWAAIKKLVGIVKYLINNGADVNSINSTGRTPLHYASLMIKYHKFQRIHNISYAQEFENSLIIVKLLLKAGAVVNAEDNAGYTPLHFAAQIDVFRPEIIRCLLNYGADINAHCYKDFTPIFRAHNKKILSFLIGNGAIVNYASNTSAYTPLFYRILDPINRELAEILLENGAHLDIINYEGKTLLEILITKYNFAWDPKILETILNRTSSVIPVIREIVKIGQDYNKVIPVIFKRVAAGEIQLRVEDLKTDDNVLVEKYFECILEIDRMKVTKMEYRNYSFFTLLVMPIEKLITIVRAQRFIEEFHLKFGKKSNIEEYFPLYGPMLRRHIETAIIRRRLVESSARKFKEMIIEFYNLVLPDLDAYNIVSYLSNADVTNMIKI